MNAPLVHSRYQTLGINGLFNLSSCYRNNGDGATQLRNSNFYYKTTSVSSAHHAPYLLIVMIRFLKVCAYNVEVINNVCTVRPFISLQDKILFSKTHKQEY